MQSLTTSPFRWNLIFATTLDFCCRQRRGLQIVPSDLCWELSTRCTPSGILEQILRMCSMQGIGLNGFNADICLRELLPSLALTSSVTPWVPSHIRPSSKIADILRVIHGDPIHCPGSSACSAQSETSLPGGCLLLFSANLLYQVGKNVFCSSWLNCFRGATPSLISGHDILWA